MLQGDDGAYYGVINIAGSDPAQPGGNCPFRTDNPTDPSSYRGWGGSGYTVKWGSAYGGGGGGGGDGDCDKGSDTAVEGCNDTAATVAAAAHSGVCAVLPTNYTTPFSEHVNFRRLTESLASKENWPTFMVIGTGRGSPPDGEIRCACLSCIRDSEIAALTVTPFTVERARLSNTPSRLKEHAFPTPLHG
jgi:hypothetical protein